MKQKSNKLLILHNRLTEYCLDIEKVAKSYGWDTWRGVASDNYIKVCEGYETVRYYGNYIHAEWLINDCSFKFDYRPITLLHYNTNENITGRKVHLCESDQIEHTFTADIFVKCAFQKKFDPRIFKNGESLPQFDGATSLYLQEPIPDIDEEIRCFVDNCEVKTASYYVISHGHWNKVQYKNIDGNIPQSIIDKTKEVCISLGINNGICLDFYKRKGQDTWFLLEANIPAFCGIYDCDVEKAFNVIVNSQIDTVANIPYSQFINQPVSESVSWLSKRTGITDVDILRKLDRILDK